MVTRRFGVCAGVMLLLACGAAGEAQPPGGSVESSTSAEPLVEATRPSDEASEPPAWPPASPEGDAPTAVVPRSARIVVLREHELLDSETRAFDRIERTLDAHGFNTVRAEPDEAEAAAAHSWLARDIPAELPAAWRAVETVFVFRLVSPEAQRSGHRVARGIDGVLVLRPPSLEPAVFMRADTRAGFMITRDWGRWALDLLEGLEGGSR